MLCRDVIGQEKELWETFTRKDEYGKSLPDEHRSLYTSAVRHDIHEPSVSNYLSRHDYRVTYPEGKKFSVCLTHDIDDIYPRLSHTLLSSLYCTAGLDYAGLKNQLSWKIKGRQYSPYVNFREIMDLEERYGGKSSFYFLSTDVDIKRFRYRIEDMESEMGNIVDKGWEVGLHGDVRAYCDPQELAGQKVRLEKALGKNVIGYRNHYLRFKVPDSWELLANAGFMYDSTLGYNNAVGFRNGMCHPFKPYNLDSGKEVDILEIPLMIMDSGIFWHKKPLSEAWEISKRLIDSVERCNGVVTLLWHNYVFGSSFRNDWVRLYKKILSYCHEKNAWITSGEELYRWWRVNGYC